MSGNAFVGCLAYALGERRIDLATSAANGRLRSEPRDLAEAGFAVHHVCNPTTSAYDLARAATARIAAAGGLRDVDAIIYATALPTNGTVGDLDTARRTRDIAHLMDFPGSRLQVDFDLDGAVVVGLNQQACTGLLGSLHLARALLAIESDWRRVLCVTADRLPDGAMYEQAYNLISDGAAACVVSRQPAAFRIIAGHQITNGGLGLAGADEIVGAFFTYTHRVVVEALEKAGLTAGDLDWVVAQNANPAAWEVFARLLGVPESRVWLPSVARAGHVVSADTIINLQALVDSGRLRPGHRLALVAAGHGLNWQCAILQATEAVS
ncbi:3-oxoacyl-[acyl-carrier-protein] synthase III C-terminal domain-containing protein [Micromonospora sp. HM5-17]|uniref:3-oxoacyl-[acyl-carrier-protein] synthase III C-terminal domain-containing protein n=1 Tax=Micromonospora sp. HM5-17 TaxID=2487710 RepID=UPI0011CDC4F4|nr:3-oxoacyl-[acyl-carrier-protein] synthase III C-terminal domain-containing protein [Micromonospora sp. HM5-17]